MFIDSRDGAGGILKAGDLKRGDLTEDGIFSYVRSAEFVPNTLLACQWMSRKSNKIVLELIKFKRLLKVERHIQNKGV